jgi:hypothetical protein
MEVTLGSQSIEEKYEQGAGSVPPLDNVDLNGNQIPQSLEEQRAMIEEKLPEMRLFNEYNRLTVESMELQMRQVTVEVMMGIRNIGSLPECPLKNELMVRINECGILTGKQPITITGADGQESVVVKGLQGLEMKIREMEALGFMANYRDSVQEAAKAQEEMKTAEAEVKG